MGRKVRKEVRESLEEDDGRKEGRKGRQERRGKERGRNERHRHRGGIESLMRGCPFCFFCVK